MRYTLPQTGALDTQKLNYMRIQPELVEHLNVLATELTPFRLH